MSDPQTLTTAAISFAMATGRFSNCDASPKAKEIRFSVDGEKALVVQTEIASRCHIWVSSQFESKLCAAPQRELPVSLIEKVPNRERHSGVTGFFDEQEVLKFSPETTAHVWRLIYEIAR